jgi:hypothetical protein
MCGLLLLACTQIEERRQMIPIRKQKRTDLYSVVDKSAS